MIRKLALFAYFQESDASVLCSRMWGEPWVRGGGGTGTCSGGVTGSPTPSPLWVIRLQQPVRMPTRGPEENHGPTLAHHPSGPSNSPLLGDLPLRAALSRQGDPAAARGPMRMRPSSRAWQGPLSSSDSTSSLSGSLPHLTRGQHPGGVSCVSWSPQATAMCPVDLLQGRGERGHASTQARDPREPPLPPLPPSLGPAPRT